MVSTMALDLVGDRPEIKGDLILIRGDNFAAVT